MSAIWIIALIGSAGTAGSPDPAVTALVEEVSAASLLDIVDDLVAFGTRYPSQPGGRAAEEYLRARLADLPLDEVILQDFDAGTDNVIGILRGRLRPEKLHVIGAHYDSRSAAGRDAPAPGADDNASGTAAVLEAARLLAGSGLRPAETIVFVLFSAEEDGLIGSSYLVHSLGGLGWDVTDMVCLDVIGYLAPGSQADLSVGSSAATAEIDALTARVGASAGAYLPEWPFEHGQVCGCSDHAPFVDGGIPAVVIFEDLQGELMSPYMHTTDDVVGKSLNSPELLEASARLGLAAVADLAGPFTDPAASLFIRGDGTAGGEIDLGDAVAILVYLFLRGPVPGCLDSIDTNDDGVVNISDAVFLLGYLFLGGEAPNGPLGTCGVDPTPDALTCESFGICP